MFFFSISLMFLCNFIIVSALALQLRRHIYFYVNVCMWLVYSISSFQPLVSWCFCVEILFLLNSFDASASSSIILNLIISKFRHSTYGLCEIFYLLNHFRAFFFVTFWRYRRERKKNQTWFCEINQYKKSCSAHSVRYLLLLCD